jgi:hypothetical protein
LVFCRYKPGEPVSAAAWFLYFSQKSLSLKGMSGILPKKYGAALPLNFKG